MRLLFTLAAILISSVAFSQNLEGVWKGSYDTYNRVSENINLYFKLNPDQSYSVYSFSAGPTKEGKDTVIVCAVSFKKTGNSTYQLKEISVVKPADYEGACMQQFELRLVTYKKKQQLEGSWKSANKDCNNGSGAVRFTREPQKNIDKIP